MTLKRKPDEMKSYAVVANFNDEMETELFKIWKNLDELGISNYGTVNQGKRPHITIADYDNLQLEEYCSDFEQFFKSKEPIPLRLSVIGSFIGTRTLFIIDPVNEPLKKSHMEYHDKFANYAVSNGSKYIPEKWIPHCTIASRLTGKCLLDAYEFCSENLEVIKGFIYEFTLLELTHDESGVVVKDSVLKRVVLKN